MQVLILAGGLGTRLRDVVSDRPKPMALINGKPFLEYLISNLREQNLCDIILAVGYMHEIIEDYFKDGKAFGVSIRYSVENKQLGTAGAIKNAEDMFYTDTIMVINGDTYLDICYKDMELFHHEKQSVFTMAVREVENAQRFGAVESDDNNRVTRFVEKGKNSRSNQVNVGIYVIHRDVIRHIQPHQNISLENDVIPLILRRYGIYCFKCNGYFIDIGINNDYQKFNHDVAGGMLDDYKSEGTFEN